MLRRLIKSILRPIADPSIEALYRICVAQARQPVFYADLHVPDTVDGRFDLLILHVLLVIGRLKEHSRETQQLFDILFADMDRNLRQMGVSDMSIAKKMKPLLAAFYGRAKVYEQALATPGDALTEALSRNIYSPTETAPDDAARLAAYARQAHASLAAQNTGDLLAGNLTFPVVI